MIDEVTNKPWGERNAYVMRSSGSGRMLCGDFDKLLHVSPFMAPAQTPSGYQPRTLALIYGQAAVLRAKGVRVHPRPAP